MGFTSVPTADSGKKSPMRTKQDQDRLITGRGLGVPCRGVASPWIVQPRPQEVTHAVVVAGDLRATLTLSVVSVAGCADHVA